MKRFGVVLVVLGVVAIVVGLFPDLVEKEPQPGFGPQQKIAVAVGGVLFLIGLIFVGVGKKGAGGAACCGKAAPEAPAPQPPPAEDKPEAPAE